MILETLVALFWPASVAIALLPLRMRLYTLEDPPANRA
jgi:hypothetical protein